MSRCHGDVCSMFAHMSRCLCQDGIPPSGFSLFTVSQSTIHWTLNTFCSCCCPSADPEDPLRVTDQTRPMGLVVCRGTSVMLVSAACLLSWGEPAMQLARHRRHAGKAVILCLVCDVGWMMVCLIRRSLTVALHVCSCLPGDADVRDGGDCKPVCSGRHGGVSGHHAARASRPIAPSHLTLLESVCAQFLTCSAPLFTGVCPSLPTPVESQRCNPRPCICTFTIKTGAHSQNWGQQGQAQFNME